MPRLSASNLSHRALKRVNVFHKHQFANFTSTMAQAPNKENDKSTRKDETTDANDATTTKTKSLDIDIISDNICPWCYVGKRRLDVALNKLPKDVKVNINWLPFELDSNLPLKGVDKRERYKRKFGDKVDAIAQRLAQVGLQCQPPIKFKFGGKIGNTFNSHRLVEYGKKHGKQDETINAIMNYYFENERDITDIDTLIEIGNKIGLPNVDKFIKSKDLNEELADELQHCRKRMASVGSYGVPTFFITHETKGHKLSQVLEGAQESSKFSQIFNLMLESSDD